MKKKLLSALVFVLLSIFVISVTAFTAYAEKITIVGTVTAIELDDNDKVVAVTIDTADGFYDVSDNSIGKELLKLSDKNITATGIVGEDKDGNRIITIETYEILGE
jgi:biopolymer transport protein ExbD